MPLLLLRQGFSVFVALVSEARLTSACSRPLRSLRSLAAAEAPAVVADASRPRQRGGGCLSAAPLGVTYFTAMNPFARIRNWWRRYTAAPTVPPGLSFPAVGLLTSSEFRYGVEILNDSQTPMSFVVQALEEHAGLSRSVASVAVAVCHSQGGVLIPTDTIESAERVARCISQAAQLQSFPLKCRAVTAPLAGARTTWP